MNSQVNLVHIHDKLISFLNNRVKSFAAGQIQSHLNEWQLLTSDEEILNVIRGDSIEFDSIPPIQHFCRNKKVSEHNAQLIDLEIEKLLKKGVIVQSHPERTEFVSPIFVVPKPDQTIRLILNLKQLNFHIKYRHFKMDNIKTVLHNITEGCFMASLDLKDAYYSVRIDEGFQKYLKFRWKDILYQFTCYPNGLAPCPRKFTKINKAPLSHLRQDNSIVSGYIDDFYLQGHDYNDCQRTVIKAVKIYDDLDFVSHPEKSLLIPSQEIVYLGFVINSVSMRVSLTPKKRDDLRRFICEILSSSSLTIRVVACLIGKIVSSLPASVYGPLYYRHLECDKIKALALNQSDFDAKMTLSREAKNDLNWWLNNLNDMYAPIQLPPITKFLSTDASKTKGWGAVMENLSTGGAWLASEFEIHVNVKEILAIYYALRSFQADI